MAQKKPIYVLTPEKLELVPYGDPTCRLCALPVEHLKKLHELKFQKRWSYPKILEYIRATHNLGEDYTRLVKHFKKHVSSKDKLISKGKEIVVAAISKELNESAKMKGDKDIEKAYTQLVQTTAIFTKNVSKLLDHAQSRLDDKTLKDLVAKAQPLDLLERLSRLLKEAREQVKDVSAMRAPKVLVAQFLESAINEFISEISVILNDMCGMLQQGITEQMANGEKLNDSMFMQVFQKAALNWKDRALALKRESMARAMTALSEMEKIV